MKPTGGMLMSRIRPHPRILFTIMLMLLLVAPVQAQVSTASISGVVADENGPIPGASVAAVNTQSGFRHRDVGGQRRQIPDRRAAARRLFHPGLLAGVQGTVAHRAGARRTDGHRRFPPDRRRPLHREHHRGRRCDATPGRQPLARGLHQHHPAADGEPPVEQQELPGVLQPRSGRFVHEGHGCAGSVIQQRRSGLQAGERVHRRCVVQERHHQGWRVHAGLQPRQPVPAGRRPGVPGSHPELQSRVREGVGRGDHRRHEVGRQRPSAATCSTSSRTRGWSSRTISPRRAATTRRRTSATSTGSRSAVPSCGTA